MTHRNLNGSSITFPQDNNIHFEESDHTYTVDGVGNMTPVSSVISMFFTPFDTEYWSLRKCGGNEEKAEELREKWKAKGISASQAGTHLHTQIETFLNTGKEADMICHIQFDGKYIHLQEDIDISTEWKYFKNFHKNTRYTPFRSEWCVYDCSTRMAGTIDLLCSCDDGTYEMYDWKRSCNINTHEENKWNHGCNGLEHLSDTAYSHYCLQQNLYRYMLEKNYGLNISSMHLVVLHPEKKNFEIIKVKPLEKEVETIVSHLRQVI